MKLYRGIFSLLLLSAYALLLLHDIIPHSHEVHPEESTMSFIFSHNHEGHHHNHEHHVEKDKDNGESDNSENNLFDDRLFDSHKHSNNNGHRHDLAYRTVFKAEPVPELITSLYLMTNLLKLPDRLGDCNSGHFAFVLTSYNPYLSSGHGLRGPPALS